MWPPVTLARTLSVPSSVLDAGMQRATQSQFQGMNRTMGTQLPLKCNTAAILGALEQSGHDPGGVVREGITGEARDWHNWVNWAKRWERKGIPGSWNRTYQDPEAAGRRDLCRDQNHPYSVRSKTFCVSHVTSLADAG